jgi:colanic acid biosynthesis glycosyl transferase WcaI
VWRPAVILATAPPLLAALEVLLAGWLAGARSFLHVQDFEVDAAFQLGLLKHPFVYRLALSVERLLLRSFPVVTTISRRMRERLIEKGVAENRSFLVPNWAGVHDFDPARGQGPWLERLKKDSKTILAVYAGNLGRKQGLETIVETARLLQDKPHIRFIVCGDGAGRKDMEAGAAGLKNMVFLPVQPLEDFIHLMIAADIHLLPQKAEAADLVMPSKLGNILASGKPLVAGAEPNTQIFDAVQGCGIAVPPDNAEEFAKAVEILAGDARLRSEMGEKARRRSIEEWSQDGILTRLEMLLRQENDPPFRLGPQPHGDTDELF